MTNPTGNWPQPHGEDQFSHVQPLDTDACVSYATTHCIESQEMFAGIVQDYSERFLAKMSGTQPWGNYVEAVFKAVQKYGMVLDVDWPEPETFTWEEYYAEIPPAVIAKGQDFLRKYDVSFRFNIPESELNAALKAGPVLAIITAEKPDHAVEVINAKTYFDSYPHRQGDDRYTNPLTSVHSYHQILITPKTHMPQIKSQAKGPERRIVLAAATPEQWIALCAVYGKDPNAVDETVQ